MELILRKLAEGASGADLLQAYPQLTPEAIRAAMQSVPAAGTSRDTPGVRSKIMENKAIFLTYLVTWCAYVPTAYIWAHRKRLHLVGVTALLTVPSATALIMSYVFLVKGGVTVAQFVAGSETGMNLWSLWCQLWPVLLFATAASGLTTLVGFVIACVIVSERRWLLFDIAAFIMSVFALFTVAANFPDA